MLHFQALKGETEEILIGFRLVTGAVKRVLEDDLVVT